MFHYDGHDFATLGEVYTYCYQKFGASAGAANGLHLENYGTDLAGEQMYQNGIVYPGKTTQVLSNFGLNVPEGLEQFHDSNTVTTDTWAETSAIKTAEKAIINNVEYTNGGVQLGSAEGSGTTLPTITKPIQTDNGSTLNNPNVMTTEKVEDPLNPGTFSYLSTLAALSWLPMPSWVTAIAPALGVALGYGMYDLSPEFWDDMSQRLMPYAYRDLSAGEFLRDQLKLPITFTDSGLIYAAKNAIEALRQGLIENGAYNTGSEECTEAPAGVTLNKVVYPIVRNTEFSTYVYDGVTYYYDPSSYEEQSDGKTYCMVSSRPIASTSYIGTSNMMNWVNQYDTNVVVRYALIRLYNSGGYSYRGGGSLQTNSPTYGGLTTYVKGHSLSPTAGRIQHVLSPGNMSSSDNDTYGQVGWLLKYGSFSGGEAIPGVTPESGATYPTDTTKNLGEIYPGWDANKISVITKPEASTYEDGVEDWYPVSLADTNYSNDTDNTSSTKTQAEAQSGTNTDTNQLEQILEGLYELTQTLTTGGTLPPNPTVPADPSGNTPTPTPPLITGAGSDLIAIYNPTKAEIQAFNQFLWDLDPTNLVNWQKVIQNPIDAIVSLHMIYVTPVTGASQNIKCGYIQTTVSSKVVTNQYVDIDCGTVDVNEYFHNIWDYIATEIQIYLPFIGIVPLHVSDIMNSTIRVRYRVDVYTGTCLAQIIVLKGNSLATLYTFTGNCAVTLPLSGGSFTNIMSTLIVMGGLVISGNPSIAATYGLGRASRGELKQNIQRSGNIGANAGAMGIRTPYLIITRKKPLDAYLYQEQYGFPANKTVTLGSVNGYTRVKSIHLSGVPCTDEELAEIERLLKNGVIIN